MDPTDTTPTHMPGFPGGIENLTVSEGAAVELKDGEILTPQHVLEALKPISDPEIHISIVELGLIYGVDVSDDRKKVSVRMTLTGPGCPVGPQILAAVHGTVAKIPGVEEPDVQLVWDPPWNPVVHASDEAKDTLGLW